MDAVVVGGGIVGLASASELARRGADVTLYERDALGAGSTDRAVGGIRAQFSTPVNVALSVASLPVWESFEERFGVDVAFRQHGYLFLARTAETAERFREDAAMQREQGAAVEVLDPAAATEYCPGLDPEPFRLATYGPRDGYADPHLAVQGYARAAREAGADLRTGVAVEDLTTDGGRVIGVVADGESHPADVVVNAAGPWAARVGAMAGLDLPIAPRRRQIAVVDPERPVPETAPLTIDMDTGSYFRPERDGQALVGGHFSTDDPDRDPDALAAGPDLAWAATAIERAGEYAAYFGPEAGVAGGWAGHYAVTPDDHPIVDRTCPGLITAAGFSGHGFQHAPATGRVVAELAHDGRARTVDASPLGRERFDGDGRTAESNVL